MTTQTVTRCRVCGRRLTKPESVKIEIGPVCKRRLEHIQLLDQFTEDAMKGQDSPIFEDEAPPTCPSCGKVSPNLNHCPSCGSPIKARPLEVAA